MTDTLETSNHAASYIGLWPIIGYVISAIIGILLGIILTPIIQPKIHRLLSTVNKLIFRRTKQLGGKWTHHWHVESSRFNEINTTPKMVLKQFGKRVSASYPVTDINGIEYTYVINGKIENNTFVSGEWYDLEEGNTYNGTFLLHIDINMNSMEGIWLGTSQDNKVKSGKWAWQRES